MRQLLIFVKYPTPGRVKTRLAASVGDRAASEIARACTELTLERLMPFREEAILCVDPPDALNATASWLGSDWSLRPQQGTTLGERLVEATGHAFGQGAHRVLVTIERGLLLRSDAFARKQGLSRAALIARGLEAVLAGAG